MTEWASFSSLMGRSSEEGLPDNHVVTVTERSLSVDIPELIQNNIKTDTVTLELDAEWEGISPVIIFECADADYQVQYEGAATHIPQAVMKSTGSVGLSVCGYDDTGEIRLVTKAAPSTFTVVASGSFIGEISEDDVSLLGQILAAAEAARDAASFTGPMDDAISGRVLGNTTVKMNYWTYNAWTDGYFLHGSSGELVPSDGFSTTDFIACVPGESIRYRSVGIYQNAASLCFYDADKAFVETHGYNQNQQDQETVYEETLTVPENARFLRFCSTYVYHSAKESRIAFTSEKRSYLALSSPSEMIESLQAEADEAGMDGTVYYEDETEDVTSEFSVKSGKYVDESGFLLDYSANPSYYIDPITLEEADGLLVTAKSMYDTRLFFILDKNRYILYVSEAEASWVDHEISKADILRDYPDAEYVILASFDQSPILKRRKSVSMQDKVSEIANSNKVPEYTLPGSIVEVDAGEEVGYVNITSGVVVPAAADYRASGYVELAKYQSIVAVVSYGWDVAGCVLYDSNKSLVKVLYDNPSEAANTVLHLDTKSLNETYPTAVYARFSGKSSGRHRLKVGVSATTDSIEDGISFASRTGNVLYGKKYAACGDSFTEASNLGDDGFDPFTQSFKSYAWLIANRSGMELYDDGVSGSTITVTNPSDPTERNPFSYQRYKEVPADADYITLMFGLNETGLAASPDTLGTRDSADNTTVWGAWNTVLEYLIENHPTARIGIIISDAWMSDSYANALKEIAEWWGIPTLDLGGDPSVPLMNSGRRSGSGLELNPRARILRDKTFYNSYDGSDAHPNAVGHEWRSTVVENWMRGL